MKRFILYVSLVVLVSVTVLPIHAAFAEVQSGYNSNTEVSFFGTYPDKGTDTAVDQDVDHKENGISTLPQTGDAPYSLSHMIWGVCCILFSCLLIRGRVSSLRTRRGCDVTSEKILS
ncbi:hypothetical protein IIE_05282 [Bacillus cereus VD045]|nr:hypothetical protein IIE_05282 [Bacillus cereus VD045]